MDNKINIAEILKGKPKGTKLYSMVLGNVALTGVADNVSCPIEVSYLDNGDEERTLYTQDGRSDEDFPGECILFPSKKMRDWEKFRWKRGDVLKCDRDFVIFAGWANDNYTQIDGRYFYSAAFRCFFDTPGSCATEIYTKAEAFEAREYFALIQKRYNGRFNRRTLEIEPAADRPEKTPQRTEQHELKPFDRVLTRDNDDDAWQANIFSHCDWCGPYPYVTIRDKWKQCIPYEGNEHLLGTTDNP